MLHANSRGSFVKGVIKGKKASSWVAKFEPS